MLPNEIKMNENELNLSWKLSHVDFVHSITELNRRRLMMQLKTFTVSIALIIVFTWFVVTW